MGRLFGGISVNIAYTAMTHGALVRMAAYVMSYRKGYLVDLHYSGRSK